jgi:hypothetical protein
MRTRLLTCLVIGVGLFGFLGAAYSHSPLPLIVMLFMGGIIIAINTMSLEMDEIHKMNRMAAEEIRVIIRKYQHKPRHSAKVMARPIKRERVNVHGVTVR